MSTLALVKSAHHRYFDELKGIAVVAGQLNEAADSKEVKMLLSELNRRIVDMAQAIQDCGIAIAKEVS